MYHSNVALMKNKGKSWSLLNSVLPGSPHWAINVPTYSMVDLRSSPENVVKSETLYLLGKW